MINTLLKANFYTYWMFYLFESGNKNSLYITIFQEHEQPTNSLGICKWKQCVVHYFSLSIFLSHRFIIYNLAYLAFLVGIKNHN